MFRMYAINSHSYTHLILALGIVREPTVWGFIISKYPGIHDIGLPSIRTRATQVEVAKSAVANRQIPNLGKFRRSVDNEDMQVIGRTHRLSVPEGAVGHVCIVCGSWAAKYRL